MRETARNLYSRLRTRLPDGLKRNVTRGLFRLGIKPTVNRKAKSVLEKAIVVFSFDFELSWAWRYAIGSIDFLEIGRRERKNVPRLLGLLDQYRIPATWATIGHLFLNGCHKEPGMNPHPEVMRPGHFKNRAWNFESGDWFDCDPCSDVEHAPEWYAPDLIEQILKSEAGHEIACHTFSHIDFSDQNCPPELADSEIRECLRVAQNFNLELRSMVFPARTYGNFEVLRRRGFICYRKQTAFDIDFPVVDPYGLVAVPETAMLDRDPPGWSKKAYLGAVRKYLASAISRRAVCHFWCHPSMDEWYLEHVFPEVLRVVSDEASRARIQIMTMKNLALHCKNCLV